MTSQNPTIELFGVMVDYLHREGCVTADSDSLLSMRELLDFANHHLEEEFSVHVGDVDGWYIMEHQWGGTGIHHYRIQGPLQETFQELYELSKEHMKHESRS